MKMRWSPPSYCRTLRQTKRASTPSIRGTPAGPSAQSRPTNLSCCGVEKRRDSGCWPAASTWMAKWLAPWKSQTLGAWRARLHSTSGGGRENQGEEVGGSGGGGGGGREEKSGGARFIKKK